MEDYTKFRLKSKEQLIKLLEGKNNLLVIACNKCFKEFTGEQEPELDEFAELVRKQGKTIAGFKLADFLCNSTLTENLLGELNTADAGCIIGIACGLGIQTLAGLTRLPVYAASDSLTAADSRGGVDTVRGADTDTVRGAGMDTGRHALALTPLLCGACGQCYLNLTGGICPVVDCAKSLVNGQCGGAREGVCEVSGDKNYASPSARSCASPSTRACTWEKIYERLSKTGREHSLLDSSVMLRDYSRINYRKINEYVKHIREKRLEGFYGGLHPHEGKKLSEHIALTRFPEPRHVVIPLSQHTGAPAAVLVKAGDTVKAGEAIGEAAGMISGRVHSSVSGTVTAIEARRRPGTGAEVLCVVIESDGKNELHESVKPCRNPECLSAAEIISVINDKGIVGMGGAGFPTGVKLKSPKPVDTVLLNGCECEPLLTADYRVMLEYTDDIIAGLGFMIKAAGAARGIIAIEDNKPEAIRLFQEKTAAIDNIEAVPVKTKYPQGAEKTLIKRVLGRSVPSGALPLDVGVVVGNVSTAKAVFDAVIKGMPLTERAVTVSGEGIKNPGNFIVKIGTSVREIIEHCGGLTGADMKVMLGGPMMGNPLTGNPLTGNLITDTAIEDFDVPVTKTVNGIIAIPNVASVQSPCIRCGRCADACPMELLPLYFPVYAQKQNWAAMRDKAVNDCVECGCCDYICPSKIPIREAIRTGKMNAKR